MKKSKEPGPQFAVCIDNAGYPASLELHKIYRVLPDADAARDEDLRVVDESGKDYLYPASRFLIVELPKNVEQALLKDFVARGAMPEVSLHSHSRASAESIMLLVGVGFPLA